jgi:hypothetical protein
MVRSSSTKYEVSTEDEWRMAGGGRHTAWAWHDGMPFAPVFMREPLALQPKSSGHFVLLGASRIEHRASGQAPAPGFIEGFEAGSVSWWLALAAVLKENSIPASRGNARIAAALICICPRGHRTVLPHPPETDREFSSSDILRQCRPRLLLLLRTCLISNLLCSVHFLPSNLFACRPPSFVPVIQSPTPFSHPRPSLLKLALLLHLVAPQRPTTRHNIRFPSYLSVSNGTSFEPSLQSTPPFW